MHVELLYDAKAWLGESPVWDSHTQTLYWLDILNKRVHVNSEILLELDDLIGCIVPRRTSGFVLTKRLSFWTFDPDSSSFSFLAALTDEPAHNRFNDGKCDPHGRFIAGTMDIHEKDATGSLYSVDGRSITKILEGITISNGMTWSPESKTFYYIDTPTRVVRAFDYDLDSGALANPRVAVSVPDSLGWPDGMTSDVHGNLWIAMWGGAQITKWNPYTGKLLAQIPVPVIQPSSCAFGGKNMNELFITSARKGLDDAALQEYPLSGGVFRVDTDVQGLPAFEFAG